LSPLHEVINSRHKNTSSLHNLSKPNPIRAKPNNDDDDGMVEDEDDYSMPGDSPNSKINGSMPKSSTAIKVTPVEIAVPGRDAGQLSQDSASVAAAAKAVEVKPKG